MWNWVVQHLPDVRPGTFEIRDFANLAIGILAAVLAYIAIRMSKRQERIAEMQANIAEKQDRIMREQLAKRPALSVVVDDGGLEFKGEAATTGGTFVCLLAVTVTDDREHVADGIWNRSVRSHEVPTSRCHLAAETLERRTVVVGHAGF